MTRVEPGQGKPGKASGSDEPGRHRSDPALTPMPDLSRRRGQLRKKTLRGMAIMVASTGGQAVLQLVFLSILARTLSPHDFGLVSGALIAVFLATALAESGVGQAIVQRTELTREHMRTGWTLSVLMGVLSWAIVAGLAPEIEELLRLPGLTPILRTISLIFVLNSLTLSDFLLSRRLEFGRLAMAELASYGVGYGAVAVTLAAMGYGPWAIVWGQVGQSAMRTVLVTIMAPFPYRPSLHRKVTGELLNFGAGLTLGRVASWAATQMDNFVVGRYLGVVALGLYGRAYQLVQMPANLVGQVANEVLFPAMSAVQGDQAKLRRVFGMGIGLMAAIALPISLLAAVTSRQLVLTLLGAQWLHLRAAFDIIIFGLLFRTSSKLTDALMKACGAVYRRAQRNTVFAVSVFVGALIGQRWGLHGVAVGVLIALAINYLYTSQLCLKLIGMSWRDFFAAHIPAVILALASAGAGLAVDRLLLAPHDPPYGVRLALVWAVGVAVCLLLVRSAPHLRVLSTLAGLVARIQGLLYGKPASVVAKLLGPGYQRLLEPEQLPVPDPHETVALMVAERADEQLDKPLDGQAVR